LRYINAVVVEPYRDTFFREEGNSILKQELFSPGKE
jgi:hypothetical protein